MKTASFCVIKLFENSWNAYVYITEEFISFWRYGAFHTHQLNKEMISINRADKKFHVNYNVQMKYTILNEQSQAELS